MKIVWHPLALGDLEQILGYCLSQFGYLTSYKVGERYKAAVARLKAYPKLGVREETLGPVSIEYRSISEYNTKIVYSIHADYVYIHLIWNCNRNPLAFQKAIEKRNEDK